MREETARRVYDAAKSIGYHAVSLLRQRVFEDLPQYRLGFILQKPNQYFYQSMAKEIENAAFSAPGVRIIPQIDFNMSATPAALVEKLKAVAARNQAIALVSPDYPAVTAAIEELRRRESRSSRFFRTSPPARRRLCWPQQSHSRAHSRMDDCQSREETGKVATFIGSHRFHGHELREIGFRSYFRENEPDFEVLDTMVNLDTEEITHEATINLLQRHPDLIGFYVCGGGMEGAISALAEERWQESCWSS